MKLLLDENVPLNIKDDLKRAGHDVEHANRKCKGMSDSEILEYALRNKRIIVSFDSDFCNLRKRENHGIIKVNGKIKEPVIPLIELLKKIKNQDVKDIYYQIDINSVFEEKKKFGKRNKFLLKQFQRIYIPLECFQQNDKIRN